MIVLDTHAWPWWTNEPGRLSRPASRAIEHADSIGVCTISALELAERAERGRLQFRLPVRGWVRAARAEDAQLVIRDERLQAFDAARAVW